MNNKFLKNVAKVFFGNVLSIISGILLGFLLPMIISVADYGYYKTFTLYMSYIGCLALGFIDGVNLKYSGTALEDLNKSNFRMYFKILFILQFILSILVIGLSLIFLKSNERIIFIVLGLIIIPNNLSGYFQQISQATQRFTEYAIRNIVKSLGVIFIVIVLFIINQNGIEVTYIHYILAFLAINYFLFGWYIATYKNIIFGESSNFKDGKSEMISFVKMGFPLMISNLCATLILNIDRQFVSVLFEMEDYAQYAFAYNLLSLITMGISAISVVLFPMLKQESKESLSKKYDKYISMIVSLVGFMLIAYFPLKAIISIILPKYNASLAFFRVIFPTLISSSALTAIMHNYYKSIGENMLFFKKSIFVLIISVIANVIAYILFKNMIAFSVATTIVSLIWYIYTEQTLVKKMSVKWGKNLIYQILIIALFYFVTFIIENIFISITLYLFGFAVLTLVFQKDMIMSILAKFKKKHSN